MNECKPIPKTTTFTQTLTRWDCGISGHNHTDEKVAQNCMNAHRWHSEGETIRAIAKKLNLGETHVRRNILGLIEYTADEKSRKAAENMKLAATMRNSGMTFREIGAQIGVTTNTAREYWQREQRRLRWVQRQRESIVKGTIDELELSCRAHNALKYFGLTSIEEIKNTPDSELLKRQNFGRKSLKELREEIAYWEKTRS